MSELTPIEKLDDAVRKFVEALEDHEGDLSSWVLCFETTKIEFAEGRMPLMHRPDMTSGPSTSPSAAHGLLGIGQKLIHAALFADDDD